MRQKIQKLNISLLSLSRYYPTTDYCLVTKENSESVHETPSIGLFVLGKGPVLEHSGCICVVLFSILFTANSDVPTVGLML